MSEEKRSEEKRAQFRMRRSDEPFSNFDWQVANEGAGVVLELWSREDDDDATRLALPPDKAKALAQALLEASRRVPDTAS